MTNKNKQIARTIPFSEEAEMGVLGSILIDPESANKSMQLLKISDFYDSKHQSIYEGIIELFNKNKNIDYISLIDQSSNIMSSTRIF